MAISKPKRKSLNSKKLPRQGGFLQFASLCENLSCRWNHQFLHQANNWQCCPSQTIFRQSPQCLDDWNLCCFIERADFGRYWIMMIGDNWESCGENHQFRVLTLNSTEFCFYQQFENCSIKFWLKYAKHWKWDGPTTFYIKTQKTLQLKNRN